MAPPIRGRRWGTFSAPRSRTAAATSKPSLTCLHPLGPRFRPGPFCMRVTRLFPFPVVGEGAFAKRRRVRGFYPRRKTLIRLHLAPLDFATLSRRKTEPCFLHIAPQLM